MIDLHRGMSLIRAKAMSLGHSFQGYWACPHLCPPLYLVHWSAIFFLILQHSNLPSMCSLKIPCDNEGRDIPSLMWQELDHAFVSPPSALHSSSHTCLGTTSKEEFLYLPCNSGSYSFLSWWVLKSKSSSGHHSDAVCPCHNGIQ